MHSQGAMLVVKLVKMSSSIDYWKHHMIWKILQGCHQFSMQRSIPSSSIFERSTLQSLKGSIIYDLGRITVFEAESFFLKKLCQHNIKFFILDKLKKKNQWTRHDYIHIVGHKNKYDS